MDAEEIDVVVIGAGQAGLATSHGLTSRGVAHTVLERGEAVGSTWAGRWDSFCLVTPNHTIRLPGGHYQGADPHGYLGRDEMVAHLRGYATRTAAPVRTRTQVTSLRGAPDGSLSLRVADGTRIRARHVVVSTGAFPRAHRPPWVADIPPWLPILDVADYRSPAVLPPGAVLVVGSGQTGCQIAEELTLSGRRVVLASGRAPWVPRRIEDRDAVDWLLETPFFDLSLADLPVPGARLLANPQLSGARGGHDLNTRTLAALGVEVSGRMLGIHDGQAAVFAEDLDESVAWGDARYAELRTMIGVSRTQRGLSVPTMPDPAPFDAGTALTRLPLRDLSAVILTTGYRPDYASWIDLPEAFDAMGFPLHTDGTSTAHPQLHFVGVHFLRSRKSSLLLGVGEDAELVADAVATSLGRAS